MPMGRPPTPVPADTKCPKCGSADNIRRRGWRTLWNGASIPTFFCLACEHKFTTAVITKKERRPRSRDVAVREEAKRGKLVVCISTKPRILARLVADCAEIGVPNMSLYLEMLCEVRFASLTAPLLFNKREKQGSGRRSDYDHPKNSSTSVALAAISKSEACRVGQMHRTHRSAGAQEKQ